MSPGEERHPAAHADDLVQCIEIPPGESSEYRETDAESNDAASRDADDIMGRLVLPPGHPS